MPVVKLEGAYVAAGSKTSFYTESQKSSIPLPRCATQLYYSGETTDRIKKC